MEAEEKAMAEDFEDGGPSEEVSVEADPAGPRRGLIGKPAPDFSLRDEAGRPFHLYAALREGPLLLAFYPGDFTPVCTKQLCNYRDAIDDFRELGIGIVGISHN